MTPEERDKLQDDYSYAAINDMDNEGVINYAAKCLNRYLEDNVSDDELIYLAKEHYPKIINETANIQKEV